MASGDIHISVVPALSTVASYTEVNPYGNTVTQNTKSIASNPAILALYINQQQSAAPATTVLQVIAGGNRLS